MFWLPFYRVSFGQGPAATEAAEDFHYNDVIMSTIASQITSLMIVYSTVYSGADQRNHQSSSASLAFVWGIHRGPVNSPHKGPVTRKMFQFDDVIMLPHKIVNHYVSHIPIAMLLTWDNFGEILLENF